MVFSIFITVLILAIIIFVCLLVCFYRNHLSQEAVEMQLLRCRKNQVKVNLDSMHCLLVLYIIDGITLLVYKSVIFGDRNENLVMVVMGNEIRKIWNYVASGNGFREEEDCVV